MSGQARRRPRDLNKLALAIVEEATSEPEELEAAPKRTPEKDPAAVALGRKGGLRGGRARAEKLSAERRREIAQKAARERWRKAKESDT